MPRLDVGKLKDDRVPEEFANWLSGVLRVLGALENPEELWSAFKTTILDVVGGCLGTHRRTKMNFVSHGSLDTIDQSRRDRLNGIAELFRELRRKTEQMLGGDKESFVRGICERVEHHLWSTDSGTAYRGINALRSSKLNLWCTLVGMVGGWLLTEESEVMAR